MFRTFINILYKTNQNFYIIFKNIFSLVYKGNKNSIKDNRN